jgi:hypothetical protein
LPRQIAEPNPTSSCLGTAADAVGREEKGRKRVKRRRIGLDCTAHMSASGRMEHGTVGRCDDDYKSAKY